MANIYYTHQPMTLTAPSAEAYSLDLSGPSTTCLVRVNASLFSGSAWSHSLNAAGDTRRHFTRFEEEVRFLNLGNVSIANNNSPELQAQHGDRRRNQGHC